MKKFLQSLFAVFLSLVFVFALIKSGFVSNIIDRVYLESKELNAYTEPASGKGTGYFRHCYEALDATSKQAYALIIQSIGEHPEKIRIPELTSEQLNAVFSAISYDNPDMLCLGSGCKLINEGRKFYFIPEYTDSADACKSNTSQLRIKAHDIAAAATRYSGEYEREKFVHDYIISSCVYTENTSADFANSAYGALILGTAACEGYSRAFQLVLSILDIDSRLVTGKAADGSLNPIGHMWNLVVINGNSYFADLTWDDPVSRINAISYAYFNVTNKMISATHSDISPAGIVCDSTKDNYFYKENLYFEDIDSNFESRVISAVGYCSSQGKSAVEFRFSDAKVYKSAKEKMMGDNLIREAFERSGIIQKNKGFTINYSENESALTFRLYLEG